MPEAISQFIDEFLEYSDQEDVKQKTKDNRRETLQKLEDYLQEKDEDIYLQDSSKVKFKVSRFFEENDSRGAIPPNIHAITSFFDYLKGEKNIYEPTNIEQSKNAVLKLKKTYEESKPVQNVDRGSLSFDQREDLLLVSRNSAKDPLKKEVMIKLVIEAGLSRSELLVLTPEDLIEQKTVNPAKIRVHKEWSQSEGREIEKEESRHVAISMDTRVRIKQLIFEVERSEDDYLIWQNPSYRKPKRLLDEILSDSELVSSDLSFKDLERNVIVDLIEKGVAQHRIQKYYGSKSAVTGDVMDKYSLNNPSAFPLSDNMRIF